VPVLPAVVAREQALEGGEQVGVRPRAKLDDDDGGRRVRGEDRQQPIVAPATSSMNRVQCPVRSVSEGARPVSTSISCDRIGYGAA
jgi:hypothetical protein